MRDVLEQFDSWIKSGEPFAVATVINTWGSAPRPIGSKMLSSLSGGIAGSVSAGCVEGAVIEAGQEVLQLGEPRLLTFGVADEQAFQVGLACGGTIQVFVEPSTALEGVYPAIKDRLEGRIPFVIVSVMEGDPELLNHKLIVMEDGSTQGNLRIVNQESRVIEAALEMLENGTSGVVELEEGNTIFLEVHPLPPRLIVVGAVHLAEALISIAHVIGFDTILIDPRKAFATPQRFPQVKELVSQWPQEALPKLALNHSAFVVILTHDPKLDDPALRIALTSGARYVGALGSKRTNQKRRERLLKAGLKEEQIGRLHAPIGLDIGGRSPGEIAVSIMAEIIQVRNGKE